MTQTISKVKTIAEDLNISQTKVAMVLYDYLAWCCQELLIDGKSKTIFGELVLDDDNRFHLENSKFGLIELINKSDIKMIRKIIEEGPDTKIFG
jgi:hypothetical protein